MWLKHVHFDAFWCTLYIISWYIMSFWGKMITLIHPVQSHLKSGSSKMRDGEFPGGRCLRPEFELLWSTMARRQLPCSLTTSQRCQKDVFSEVLKTQHSVYCTFLIGWACMACIPIVWLYFLGCAMPTWWLSQVAPIFRGWTSPTRFPNSMQKMEQ